jgi:hypothetical protein
MIVQKFASEEPKVMRHVETPLRATQNVEILKLLLAHGAKPLPPQPDRYCEVEWFIGKLEQTRARTLVAAPSKIDGTGHAQAGHFRLLHEQGHSPSRPQAPRKCECENGAGPTATSHPGHAAAAGNATWMEVVKILLDAGVSPNGVDDQGKTPLALAGENAIAAPAPQPSGRFPAWSRGLAARDCTED